MSVRMMGAQVAALRAGDGVLFGMDIPERVNVWLQAAAQRPDDEAWAEQNLMRAMDANPEQIEVYIALAKFYCYRGRLAEAESMANTAVEKAAQQAGVDADWTSLQAGAADFAQPSGPARSLLYGLKALAFISLRQQRGELACAILGKLALLDPQDRVGAGVVREMALAVEDRDD